MTGVVQSRAVSAGFGLVMVAASAVQADDAALMVAGIAVLAVLVGSVFRPCATLAALLAGAVLVLSDAAPMLASLCGLAAAGYLVLRHADNVTAPTVVGALGFTTVGLAAVSIPVELPWVPLLAPVAMLALVVLATRPFWVDGLARVRGSTRRP
ncbi:hypothetical protein H7I53_06825 [Mycolicibacterium pulveris]|uniref:Integral membrane protein n=1 Tax=Mycolicibacterium pulveris TaxID=36813 RepID=A0A7I7UIX0_MYCPV|nr:hypothetical protein [Mycolicibacterium pulveris]MCV6979940.1 hypothetical protein [Mycolicibacterium pulveris]BBY81312.1 integral membrane protein [Mycolicibacterium pulveris]